MTFPDSKRKAPNVFFNVTDDTGAPSTISSVSPTTPVGVNVPVVITVPGAPTNVVATLLPDPFITYSVDTDRLMVGIPSISAGVLVENITYVTTAIYPYNIEENLSIGLPSISAGSLDVTIKTYSLTERLDMGLPSISAGSLDVTIVYKTYLLPERLDIGLPSISAGALDTTIVYRTYLLSEGLNIGLPSISAGALDTTIIYIVYNYQVEKLTLTVPSIVAGTLE